jgi:hypothetical protein
MARIASIGIVAAGAVAVVLSAAVAQVYTDHLVGKYATMKDGCADPEFEIRRGIVEGPNVFCILGALKDPVPGGTEAYEANCRQPGAIGTLTFDLSAKDDHTRILLPETADWITLYPCK